MRPTISLALAASLLTAHLAVPAQVARVTQVQTAVNEYGGLTGPTRDISVELRQGTNMAAVPSPDGTMVAFTAQGALWVMGIEGGRATRITGWDVEPTAPVWSPDGRVIAFQNYTPDGNYHIWTIEPNGNNIRELTTGYFDDREPAWTPDGSAVVFASDRSNDGQYKVWSYSLASGAYRQLTTGLGAESNPVVSPDGRMLAFADANRVFTAPVAGGAAPTLVGNGSVPQFAPDGSLIYQNTPRSLLAGSREIARGEDLFPFPVRFLPDGGFLYTADGQLRRRDRNGSSLRDIPFTATLNLRRPQFVRTKDHRFGDLSSRQVKGISAPVISPDGQSVAFVALNDVWVMRMGQAPMRLTNDTDRDGNVQWTADGNAVYFSSEKNNAGQLAIDRVVVATGVRTRLARIAGKSMVSPKLSPAGDRIAYTTLSGQLEIWTLATNTAELIMPQVSTQLSTPQWTPDGQRILLVDNERINNRFREGYNKLRVIDVNARTARFHAVAPAPQQISDREEGAAVLSPDGRTLAFVMDSVLHVMPVDANGVPSGPSRQITTEVADLPSWAGDSRTLLYKSGTKLKTILADGTGGREVAVDLQWRQKVPKGLTIVRAGRLWDGTSRRVLTDVDIVIERNRIVAIHPHRPDAEATATRYVDASAFTVMPGLWDAHIHPLTLYQGGQFGQISALMLSYGLTSTLSVAGPSHQSVEMREALESGDLIGPRLFVSPPLWEGNRQFYSFARTLRTPAVADLEIAKAVEMEVDFLKSYVRAPIPIMAKIAQAALNYGVPSGTHMLSPGAATGIGGTTHLSATQRMGYGWAKSPGLISYQDAVAVHAQGEFRVIDTLFSSTALVGADRNLIAGERFQLIPPNFLAGLQSTPVPTASTMEGIRRDAKQSGKIQLEGGLLALGTDAPLVTPGVALHTNLRASGLVTSNVQALQNVTINAARMAFADRDLGTVEVGKLADLVVVQGDPLTDLKAAANVRWVVKNGNVLTINEIVAPFNTPAALAARKESMGAYGRMCRADPHSCSEAAKGHAH